MFNILLYYNTIIQLFDMDKIEDKKVKAKKVGKILKQIFIGNNIFHIFFRVYIFVIILGGVLLYVP